MLAGLRSALVRATGTTRSFGAVASSVTGRQWSGSVGKWEDSAAQMSGNDVVLTNNNGDKVSVDVLWLRTHCTCPKCTHPQTNNKLFNSSAWTLDTKPTSIDIVNGSLSVKWDKEHTSTYGVAELVAQIAQGHRRLPFPPALTREEGLRITKNKVNYDAVMNDEHALFKFLSEVNRVGLAVLKDVPATDQAVFDAAQRFGGAQKTIYGTTFDVKVDKIPINIAYTNLELEPHLDIPYYESPVGLQLLHAKHFRGIAGGESTFIDGLAVAERFRAAHPEEFDALTRLPVTFMKWHLDRALPVHIEYSVPIIRTNPSGDVVAVSWSPPFEGPLRVEQKDVRTFYRSYKAFAMFMRESEREHLLEFKMNEGDMVVFNNRRVLHGRRAFFAEVEGEGERHLRGAYVHIDEYLNVYHVLADKYGGEVYSVCNGNWA